MRSERLRDLHRERSDTPAGAVHEDPLSRLHLRVIAKTLECGASRDADRGRLLERRVARLWCETLLARERVLGERRGRVAEHLVARSEARHAHADRLDDPGEVHTADRLGLLAHQGRRHAYHEPAMHAVPVERVHRGCANPDQDASFGQGWPRDLPEMKRVGRAVSLLDDRPHRLISHCCRRDHHPFSFLIYEHSIASCLGHVEEV